MMRLRSLSVAMLALVSLAGPATATHYVQRVRTVHAQSVTTGYSYQAQVQSQVVPLCGYTVPAAQIVVPQLGLRTEQLRTEQQSEVAPAPVVVQRVIQPVQRIYVAPVVIRQRLYQYEAPAIVVGQRRVQRAQVRRVQRVVQPAARPVVRPPAVILQRRGLFGRRLRIEVQPGY